MPDGAPLVGTPFYFLGPDREREAELAAYIRREHRRGRRLAEILEDGRVRRCRRGILYAVLRRPALLRSLARDDLDAIRRDQAALLDASAPLDPA